MDYFLYDDDYYDDEPSKEDIIEYSKKIDFTVIIEDDMYKFEPLDDYYKQYNKKYQINTSKEISMITYINSTGDNESDYWVAVKLGNKWEFIDEYKSLSELGLDLNEKHIFRFGDVLDY